MTATQTLPQMIDGEILELAYRLGSLMSQETLQLKKVRHLDNQNGDSSLDAEWRTAYNTYLATLDSISETQQRISVLESVHTVYDWTRAFIVSGGHVHRSTRCHTCFTTTVFYGVPQCSGMDEAEIVELAGERACTVCYPTAPVDVLKRKTQLFTRDEAEKQRIADERAAKRNAKEAAKVTVFLPLEGKNGRNETFGTVRSAKIEATDNYGWVLYSAAYYNGNTVSRHLNNFEAIVAAVAEREDVDPTELAAELIGKATAKFVKEACAKDMRTGKPYRTKTEALELLDKANKVIADK